MRLNELRKNFYEGKIEKKLYWTIVRENYTHILPQLQKIVETNKEIQSVEIRKDGVVLKKASGVLLYFDFSQAMCRAETEMMNDGDPEKDDMKYINDYLYKHENSCMLDIGANAGIFSLDFYQDHKNLTYYLFEPVPYTFEWLLKNAEINEVNKEKYLPFNIGLSDEKGSFDFYVPASNEAASLVANEDAFFRKKATEDGEYTGNIDIDKVLCKVEKLDEFAEEHKIDDISFIKIDVEGNELNVLKGARNTLKKNKPLVYCELLRKHAKRFGYHPNDVINYMAELGYVCKVIRDGEMVNVDKITDDTIETNFFFMAQ